MNILVDLKLQEKLENQKDILMSFQDNIHVNQDELYEKQLIKLEADIRNHIKIEQQLKLHIDSLQDKIEVLERKNRKIEKNADFSERMKELETKNKHLQLLINKYENQCKQIPALEKQIKILKMEIQRQVKQDNSIILDKTNQKIQENPKTNRGKSKSSILNGEVSDQVNVILLYLLI